MPSPAAPCHRPRSPWVARGNQETMLYAEWRLPASAETPDQVVRLIEAGAVLT